MGLALPPPLSLQAEADYQEDYPYSEHCDSCRVFKNTESKGDWYENYTHDDQN